MKRLIRYYRNRILVALFMSFILAGAKFGDIGAETNKILVGLPKTTTTVYSPTGNQAKDVNEVDYYFTKENQHPDKQLVSLINSAQGNLDIAIYSLTNKDIVNAITKAKSRGVVVRVITDRDCSTNKSETIQLDLLRKDGITVKINSHEGLMHLKVSIIDNAIVTTGSFNYTAAASTTNDEVLVVLHSYTAVKDFGTTFENMWNDTANFTVYK